MSAADPAQTGESVAGIMRRLGRRGTLTIEAEDDTLTVTFGAPRRRNTTVDHADVWERERLGPRRRWTGDGTDLLALLAECEEATRPPHHGPDEIVWLFDRRRSSRTFGPPLPWWSSWKGWTPGQDRWLSCFDHGHEYLNRYLAEVKAAHEDYDRWSRLYPDRYPARATAASGRGSE